MSYLRGLVANRESIVSPSNTGASDYYNTRFTESEARGKVWAHIVQWIVDQGLVPSGVDVLELAAGYGDFIRQVPANRKVAMDINPGLPEPPPDRCGSCGR